MPSMLSKENTHALLVGIQTFTDTMEINAVVPQENKDCSTSISSYTALKYIPKEYVILLQRYLLKLVHCFTLNNSQI